MRINAEEKTTQTSQEEVNGYYPSDSTLAMVIFGDNSSARDWAVRYCELNSGFENPMEFSGDFEHHNPADLHDCSACVSLTLSLSHL